MNSFDLINQLYKPYRITKVSKCTIIDSMDGKFVIKPKGEKNVKELFQYLKSRNFYHFPEIVDASRSDVDIYEYVEDVNYPSDQKAIDMIKLVAKLHRDTAYSKEVREDKFKEIYDDIKNNLEYYKNKYSEKVKEIELAIFMSPSEYLFIRNSSKLFNQISFCENKLDEWYESVKGKREIRVSTIHNNLALEHYLRGSKEALVSWDNAKVDSPILDIYKLYRKEALNVEFGSVLKNYLRDFPLEKDEQDLLMIMLCMPSEIDFEGENEFARTMKIGESLDYVFKTEELARPYYFVDDKK